MSRHPLRSLVPLIAVLAAACVEPAPAATPVDPTVERAAAARVALLDSVRAATERFQDVDAAVAAGYVAEGGCVELPGSGAMGVHYVHPGLAGLEIRDGRVHIGDARLDPLAPEILIYEPQRDGRMQLVAVEWVASTEAWGERPRPSLFGVAFDHMYDDPATPDVDEGHAFTPHYDQHVWLYRANPAGMFAQWNASVTCPAGTVHTDHAGH